MCSRCVAWPSPCHRLSRVAAWRARGGVWRRRRRRRQFQRRLGRRVDHPGAQGTSPARRRRSMSVCCHCAFTGIFLQNLRHSTELQTAHMDGSGACYLLCMTATDGPGHGHKTCGCPARARGGMKPAIEKSSPVNSTDSFAQIYWYKVFI